MREMNDNESRHVEEIMRQLRERVTALVARQARPMEDDECIVHTGTFVIQRVFKG